MCAASWQRAARSRRPTWPVPEAGGASHAPLTCPPPAQQAPRLLRLAQLRELGGGVVTCVWHQSDRVQGICSSCRLPAEVRAKFILFINLWFSVVFFSRLARVPHGAAAAARPSATHSKGSASAGAGRGQLEQRQQHAGAWNAVTGCCPAPAPRPPNAHGPSPCRRSLSGHPLWRRPPGRARTPGQPYARRSRCDTAAAPCRS